MKTVEIEKLIEKIDATPARSAWQKGVKSYAIELLENVISWADCGDEIPEKITEKYLLNGAENWLHYSMGGGSLCYNAQIAERLCTPSELRKMRGGLLDPNSRENWIEVQARALFQAWKLIENNL